MIARGYRRRVLPLKKIQRHAYCLVDGACPAVHPGKVGGVFGQTVPRKGRGGIEPGPLAWPRWRGHAVPQRRRRARQQQGELDLALTGRYFDHYFKPTRQFPATAFPCKLQALDQARSSIVRLARLAPKRDQGRDDATVLSMRVANPR